MKRREALVGVIEALHCEIDALKTNDIAGLEAATARKLRCIEDVAACDQDDATPEITELAREAHRLNETCRIYVNLMAANVRRRLQVLAGSPNPAYRPTGAAAYA
ncbi:MAG TPA: flagellar protein FlgN [Sphingomonas sp.]|nr:flagellar protein FlgN [Sphingomonas sp.]